MQQPSSGPSRPVKKRQRPHFNCAECRRTKSKCDRTWPCGECVRKGIPRLCPESVASTEPSKSETIALLTQRIEALETARKHVETEVPQADGGGTMPARASDMSAILSELAMGKNDHKRYLGTEASAFYLETPYDSEDEGGGPLFGSRRRMDISTPWGRSGGVILGASLPGALLDRCRELLPNRKEAKDLFERYWSLTSWRMQPMTRTFFLETILPSVYDSPQPHAHDLAVLLSTQAVTMLFDPNSFIANAFSPDDYHDAAYACLVAGHFYTDTTLSSLISLAQIGSFLLNSDDRKLPNANFAVFGLAIRLAIIAGYHRDPAHMALSSEEMDQRRRIWHELLASDRLHCLPALLPNSVDTDHYDTRFPVDTDANAYFTWKWKIGVEIARVVDFWTSTKISPYTVLQDIDASIRALLHSMPPGLCGALPSDAFSGKGNHEPTTIEEDPILAQQRIRLAMHFGMVLFYLHRPCFMRALVSGDSAQEPSVQTVIEACKHVTNLTEKVMTLDYTMLRWFSFAADLFAILHCQTVLVVKTKDKSLLAPRMALLEKGVGILQWTATARPNSKNRALLRGAQRLLANAKQSQNTDSLSGLSPLWQDFMERDPLLSTWPATSSSGNTFSFSDMANWDFVSSTDGLDDNGLSVLLGNMPEENTWMA